MILDRVIKWIGVAVILSSPVHAQEASAPETSDQIIAYWAKHAIPLADFVAQGFGMSDPSDAASQQWCPYQAVTLSLAYADHPNCARLLTEMRKQGRIE